MKYKKYFVCENLKKKIFIKSQKIKKNELNSFAIFLAELNLKKEFLSFIYILKIR